MFLLLAKRHVVVVIVVVEGAVGVTLPQCDDEGLEPERLETVE
jgi:hypothetical protein